MEKGIKEQQNAWIIFVRFWFIFYKCTFTFFSLLLCMSLKWAWLHVAAYYAGGCLNLLIVSNSRSAGPSFMLNLSRRWCSLSKNILCPLISYSWNESAQSVNPCSRRNSATSSGSHSLGLRVYVPSSVRCPVCFRWVERLERRGRKSEASAQKNGRRIV
jgi:hypothetical protein